MYYVDPGESFHKSVAKFGVDTAENEFRVNPNRVRVLRVKLRVICVKHLRVLLAKVRGDEVALVLGRPSIRAICIDCSASDGEEEIFQKMKIAIAK